MIAAVGGVEEGDHAGVGGRGACRIHRRLQVTAVGEIDVARGISSEVGARWCPTYACMFST